MDKPMQLLILVLNKTECLDHLFKELLKIGIKGATVLESTGMARILNDDSMNIFGTIRLFIDENRESNRTIFMAVNDDLVPLVRQTINDAVCGLDQPDTGVLFGVPISFFDGKVSRK